MKLLRLSVAAILAVVMLLTASPASAAPAANDQPAITVYPDGSYRVDFPENGLWPVSYCSGTSTGPRLLGGAVDFGGQQTCDNAADWPHRIIVNLQSTCPDIWCIIFSEEGDIDSGWRMARVATAQGGIGCSSSDRRKYRLVVEVYARATHIGNAVGTYEPILSCTL